MQLAFGMEDALGAAIKGLIVAVAILQIVPVLVYLERRISAWIQGRLGPNRVGPQGLFQPLADAVKLAFKEEIIPKDADKTLYLLAPFLAFFPAAAAFAFIPFGAPTMGEGPDASTIDMRVVPGGMGILALLAISSLGVYGIALAGWSSNSKYPLMGAVRASSQMLSYAVAMELAIVAIMAQGGSTDLQQFVAGQNGHLTIAGVPLEISLAGHSIGIPNWNIFHQPIAFLIFVVAMFAENNRLPFDLPEAEPELGAGYHTEYTGLKFAMFFMGEYVAMITMGGLCVTLFLGGWTGPFVHPTVDPTGAHLPVVHGWGEGALSILWFLVKLGAVLVFYIWIRWTLPRFRYDQLMRLGWKLLIPVGLANLLITGVILAL